MVKQEETNRKRTAATDPGRILENVAGIPHTFPSWYLLNESLPETASTTTTAHVNLRRGGPTDLPKVSDVIYCKAGVSLGLGKPVFASPFGKLHFLPQGHFSSFGDTWKNAAKNFRTSSVSCRNQAAEVCCTGTELLPLTQHQDGKPVPEITPKKGLVLSRPKSLPSTKLSKRKPSPSLTSYATMAGDKQT